MIGLSAATQRPLAWLRRVVDRGVSRLAPVDGARVKRMCARRRRGPAIQRGREGAGSAASIRSAAANPPRSRRCKEKGPLSRPFFAFCD